MTPSRRRCRFLLWWCVSAAVIRSPRWRCDALVVVVPTTQKTRPKSRRRDVIRRRQRLSVVKQGHDDGPETTVFRFEEEEEEEEEAKVLDRTRRDTQRRIAELRGLQTAIATELAELEGRHHHRGEPASSHLFSDDDDETATTLTSSTAQTTPRAQIKALYEAFNARDANRVAALLTEDVVYEDLLLGDSTVCRGKQNFARALEWHPAFVSSRLNIPFPAVQVIVDRVACDSRNAVGVEWHVEVNERRLPLGRGLSLATLDEATGKLDRVVDICEAPWRVVGLLVRPLLSVFGGFLVFGGGLMFVVNAVMLFVE